ncbi:hypothetical protein WJX72_007233 [[Myrmecia] bisecta]|uniref:fructose-bisphosphate aldolase n=1 Tax=[Myrmecia] bisecta TaxID=41462 RepID=A0AAW1PEL2_9CHLO
MEELRATAARLCSRGRGLLASDESTGTIGKRLEKAGLQNTEENRRSYRELFYTADIGQYISGVILFKETLLQSTSDGTPFVDCLTRQGVLPGIKVDEGLVPLEGSNGETTTRGLDTLAANCKEYHKQGARFVKWRAALKIDEGCPSEAAVQQNAQQLAEYAAICQACDLVPIVEPELLIDGSHDIHHSAAVSERVISACIAQLWQHNVVLEGMLLKPQMVLPGADYAGPKATSQEIAQHTLTTMRRCVPPAVPGIMFLSGGQSEEEATVNLNTLNSLAAAEGKAPWALSFSYGRALQASVMKIWSEDQSQKEKARQMAAALAAVNSSATLAKYGGHHPSLTSASGNLREGFRGWRTDVS